MRSITLGLALMLSIAVACEAGEPAAGKVCHYNPRPTTPDTGLAEGEYNCATSLYGVAGLDWSMGGDYVNHSATDVTVVRTAPSQGTVSGCEKGREIQVLVAFPGVARNEWVFPRFLDCP